MAAVRTESDAFGDVRYERLARLAGLADADHARGKMARLWRQCTMEKRYVLPAEDVIQVLGENAVVALTESRLGEQVEGGVRIRGTKGRIEWLDKLRKNGQKGGRPKKTKSKPSGFQESNPLALAPALLCSGSAPVQISDPESPPPLVLLPQEADPPKPPDPVESLWDEQERLRREAMPKSRGIKLTDDRRKRVQDRLDDGYTEDDCRAVLAEYAREARLNGGEWFNGETNWRPENFARALGRVGTGPRAGPSPVPQSPRRLPPTLVPRSQSDP